jgi:hypothetical protein
MLYLVHSTCKSCALLKRHWDKAVDALQDSDLLSVNAVVYLIVAVLPVYRAGGWWYVLHYANTVCLAVFACTFFNRNVDLLAGLLNYLADDLEQHMSKDSDLWGCAMFTIFASHMLYACWINPWLLVPVLSLAAVLACSMSESDAHSDGFPDRLMTLGGSDDEDDEDDDEDEYEDESYGEEEDADDEEEDHDDGSGLPAWEGVDQAQLMAQLRALGSRVEADMDRWYRGGRRAS